MTKMGCKRDPNEPRKGLKRTGRIRPKSKTRRREDKTYALVKRFGLGALVALYGKPDGTGRVVMAPCACCKNYFHVSHLEPDHILGRHGERHGELDRFWDPGNLQYLCHTCHEQKTNRRGPVLAVFQDQDYATRNLPFWKSGMLDLRTRFITALSPIYGTSARWTSHEQAEVIAAVLGESFDAERYLHMAAHT